MGLLDSLFNPSVYGGDSGLLSRLSQLTAAVPPSAGFPDAPASFNDRFGALPPALARVPTKLPGRPFDAATFDPATYAPNQAQPINVGGYMMPRIGSADLYGGTPAGAPTDVSAASRTPVPPPVAPAPSGVAPPADALPPALGGGNYLSRLKSGGSLIGSLFSDTIQQQNLKAQYDSLVPVLGPQKALLAVMNPEAGKTLLSEALTNKADWGVIKDDPLTGKEYGWINKIDQTINGQPSTPASATPTGGSGSLAALSAAHDAGVTGDALYEYLPPAYRNTVKAMIEGRQPLPSTTAMRSPATLALIDAAHAIDPTFDATVWKARNEAGPDWTKGKSSEMVRAANQTLAHVGSLMDAMDNLHNRSVPAWNYIANTAQEATGSGTQGAFRTNAHAVAEEMSKVFKGANLSDSEIRHWEQNLSENMSPEQQRAQIAKLSELLHGSLQALEEKRLTAMGPAMAAKQGPLIKEDGQKVLARIDDWLKGASAAPSAPAAPLPSGWSVKVH